MPSIDFFLACLLVQGAVGILLTLTVQCEPAFALEEVNTPLTLNECLQRLPQTLEANEHMRFCWYPHTPFVMQTTINRTKQAVVSMPNLLSPRPLSPPASAF